MHYTCVLIIEPTELFFLCSYFSFLFFKLKNSWLVLVSGVQHSNSILYRVHSIRSYWLYSLCCTSMQFIHFITSHLYLLVPTNWWMAKEDVVCHGILLSHKKEWNLAICHNMDRILLNEISQRRTSTLCLHLYVESKKQNKWTDITKQDH